MMRKIEGIAVESTATSPETTHAGEARGIVRVESSKPMSSEPSTMSAITAYGLHLAPTLLMEPDSTPNALLLCPHSEDACEGEGDGTESRCARSSHGFDTVGGK
ncbi:hypothetical protein AAE478_002220 [Parahypoxylon ruwenzoriense]